MSLFSLFPDNISLIIVYSDCELNYCKYKSRNKIFDDLIKYKKELTEDAFLEWGIIYNTDTVLIELFITESKYIKFWGIDDDKFKNVLTKFGLKQIDNLEFIDEYPKIREPLTSFQSSVMNTNELIEELKE